MMINSQWYSINDTIIIAQLFIQGAAEMLFVMLLFLNCTLYIYVSKQTHDIACCAYLLMPKLITVIYENFFLLSWNWFEMKWLVLL